MSHFILAERELIDFSLGPDQEWSAVACALAEATCTPLFSLPHVDEVRFPLRGGRGREAFVPLTSRGVFRVGGDGTIWWAQTRNGEFLQFDTRGDTLRRITVRLPQRPIAQAERDTLVSMMASLAVRPSDVDKLPTTTALFAGFAADESGTLAVATCPSMEGVKLLGLVTPDGSITWRKVTGQRLAENVMPVFSGNALYAVAVDSSGNQELTRWLFNR